MTEIHAPIPPREPQPTQCNHVLHLLITLFTCGMWVFVWPLVWMHVALKNRAAERLYRAERREYETRLGVWQTARYNRS